MKKAVCLMLALCILFTLAACGKKKEGTLVAYKDDEGNIVTEYIENTNDSDKTPENIDDEVVITIPFVLVGKEYRNDLAKYCEVNGFERCELNEEAQTVTITMGSLTYDLNLMRMGIQVMSNIGSTVDSGEYPYVRELESYSENFDEIVMLVDGEGYKADKQSSLLPYFLGECGMFYQIYTTENVYKCTVKIKDAETGEIIDEKYYETDNTGKEY